jgi:hypothetical protein
VTDPSWEEFAEIFRRAAASKEIPFSEAALAYLIREHYIKANRPPRACHARDLLDQILDISNYLSVSPSLSKELIDRAALSYFVNF